MPDKKPKAIQKFMIGVWTDGNFVPEKQQPEEPITDFASMLSWARATFKENPGKYSFIRVIQGNMNIARQTTFLASFGMTEDDDTIPA